MIIPEPCSNNTNPSKRRLFFYQRKLEMLKFYKDSLVRRLASLEASIEVLQSQIERDNDDS